MRPGGGKAKGAQFEREVCKSLSLWVTNGANEDVFWRSAMSGGRATVSKGKVRQAGDITAVSSEGYELCERFYFECKHYKSLGLDSFLIKRTGTLAKFWSTACHHARKYDRQPLLICRQNGWPILIVAKFPFYISEGLPATPVILSGDVAIYVFDEVVGERYEPIVSHGRSTSVREST